MRASLRSLGPVVVLLMALFGMMGGTDQAMVQAAGADFTPSPGFLSAPAPAHGLNNHCQDVTCG